MNDLKRWLSMSLHPQFERTSRKDTTAISHVHPRIRFRYSDIRQKFVKIEVKEKTLLA
jgi:hypothetical protein